MWIWTQSSVFSQSCLIQVLPLPCFKIRALCLEKGCFCPLNLCFKIPVLLVPSLFGSSTLFSLKIRPFQVSGTIQQHFPICNTVLSAPCNLCTMSSLASLNNLFSLSLILSMFAQPWKPYPALESDTKHQQKRKFKHFLQNGQLKSEKIAPFSIHTPHSSLSFQSSTTT